SSGSGRDLRGRVGGSGRGFRNGQVMSQTRLFGNDGVRGTAGEYPLDHETVARLGAALVRAMRGADAAVHSPRALRFLVGRDTRESGEWIERELGRGVHSEGAAITSAGVIPT